MTLTFLASLLILLIVIRHRRQLQKIADLLAEGATDNGETLKGVVTAQNDATRKHVSHAVDAIRHDAEMTKLRVTEFIAHQKRESQEFRKEQSEQRTRLRWVIGVVDGLVTDVKALPEQIRSWFRDRPPPP